MALNPEFSAFVEDILAGFGPVTIKSMFGGGGVYFDGLMFALIADDVLYLKADRTTSPEFEREGSEPFTFTSKKPEFPYDVILAGSGSPFRRRGRTCRVGEQGLVDCQDGAKTERF